MLDRRNFLGFAATATVAVAIGLMAGQTVTFEYGDAIKAEPATESSAAGRSRHDQRSMRQSAVAPDGAGALSAGESQGNGVHPRRAARGQLGPTDEAGVAFADADFSDAAGRDGRGARVARP